MTVQDAVEYINLNIQEGIWDEEMFKKMTDEELIKFAEEQMAKADAYWNDNEHETD